MANGIGTGDPRGFNKGRSSKFREGSRVRQTSKEVRRIYRPKRCGNNNMKKTVRCGNNKMKKTVRKTLMIKINEPRLRNLDNLN